MSMDLTFDFDAEMPASKRAGAGRPPTEWEKHLDPVRKNKGKAARIAVFTDTQKTVNGDVKLVSAQAQAMARISSMSQRLRSAVPLELWKFNTRKYEDGSVGLWVTFTKTMNQDEYAEYEKKRNERAARIRAGRGKNTTASTEGDGNSTELSPAERVKAARAQRANVAQPVSD